jgi:hypothetical protein
MGRDEIIAVVALAAFVAHAYHRRPSADEDGWRPLGHVLERLGHGRGRPTTAWELAYVLAGSALLIWSLRIAHSLYFGSS